MPYRGRLIWPFLADIERYNSALTEANAGPLPGGFDFDFKEPVQFADGTDARVYDTPIRLNCQVETEEDPFDRLRMMNLGDDRSTELKLCFHFQELEDNLLVDANGRALITKGDRLVAIYDQDLTEIDNYGERNLVVVEAQPRSAGLSGLRRNLLLVTFRERDYGTSEV